MTTHITETQFQATLMEAVRALGGLVYHAHDSRKQVRRGDDYILVGDKDAKGYPDLTMAMPVRGPYWAELKKGPRDYPTEEQKIWLSALPAHRTFLWRVADMDDALRIIQEGHEMCIPDPVNPYAFEPTCWTCQINSKTG